jgi:hypothetical protein
MSLCCSPEQNKNNKSMEQTMLASNNEAELKVQVLQTTKSSIQISYHFKNKSVSDIYLFNKLFDNISDEGVFDYDKSKLYVIVGNDGVLISKSIIEVPKNIKVEYKEIPCTTKVLPMTDFSEIITVQLPLKLNEPYGRRKANTNTKDLPLYFNLGYFVGVADAEKMAKMVKTPSGLVHYFHPFAFQDQKILQVGPFENKITTFLVE